MVFDKLDELRKKLPKEKYEDFSNKFARNEIFSKINCFFTIEFETLFRTNSLDDLLIEWFIQTAEDLKNKKITLDDLEIDRRTDFSVDVVLDQF